jgi:heme exporter protein B
VNALTLLFTYFKREWLIQIRQIRLLLNGCLFFLMILLMFPMTLKPEIELMRTIVPGLLWIAVLLTVLLSADRLYTEDVEHGVMEQWLISGRSLPLILNAKILAHWFLNMMPVMLLCPLVALLFSLSLWETAILVCVLLCGTPALYYLCALAAAFGIGVHQKGALMALIVLPLALPLLIFGSGTVTLAMQGMPVGGYCALLLGLSVFAVGLLPYAIAGVIRISVHE